jgi:predicted esterase
MKIVAEEERNGIPQERIFLCGFSQGGALAMHAAVRSKRPFAAVLPLSTWFPMHREVADYVHMSPEKRIMPILVCHADSDEQVILEWAQGARDLLKYIGFENVEFNVYPGMGHSSCEAEFKDIASLVAKIAPS